MNALVNKSRLAETAIERDPRWEAIARRDRASDGKFFYSVSTTGVYCRPSCPSRPAKPENVAFHRDLRRRRARRLPALQALQARPGRASGAAGGEDRRDLPDHRGRRGGADARPNSPARAGLSPYHFHRVFKAVTGVTPKAYADRPSRASACARRSPAPSDA